MKSCVLLAVGLVCLIVAPGRAEEPKKVCEECAKSTLHCCIGSNMRHGVPYCAKLQDFGQVCRPGNLVLPNPNPAQPRIYMSVCPCKPGLTCSKSGFCQ